MRPVTGIPPTPDRDAAPRVAGEQRLARPPSERYGAPSVAQPPSPPSAATSRASAVRGIAFGAVAAILGAAGIVLLGGALAVSAGLLVVAAALGYAVGVATVAGAGDTISRAGRPWIAAALAGLGALLGQVGLWLFARTEGGVLPLIDYLGQTFGPLVPLELLLAAGVAWWRAR
jgi:hypothetical protein